MFSALQGFNIPTVYLDLLGKVPPVCVFHIPNSLFHFLAALQVLVFLPELYILDFLSGFSVGLVLEILDRNVREKFSPKLLIRC